ncbi:MAG: PLP-dependent aminotransferase family protein [Pseudomonadota bacterium]
MNEADTLANIQLALKQRWEGRDFTDLVADATRALMRDRGDWDPPEGVVPKRDMIRLAIGIPDSATLPKEALLASIRRTVESPGEAAFVYGFGMGYTRLRAMLAERYSAERGLAVTEDWFQLTNGSAGAIDLICRTLINPGDVIITESPTYMGTLRNFKGVQADVHAVAMDADGLLTDELEALINQLKREGKQIKLIYTISTFHNPTGATLTLARRLALLDIASRHNILILDDDAYGDLTFVDRPPTALTTLSGGYGVITVGTFSKILATGLRIGWIHGEPGIVALMGQMRFAMGLNQIMVRAVADYMQDSQLDDHIARVRALYARKMNTLADALVHHAGDFMTFTRPAGGFYLWANLLDGLRAVDVWRTSAEEGVAFTPGGNFFASRLDPGGQHIRIAFPWTPLAELEEGARRIGAACRRVSRGDITP